MSKQADCKETERVDTTNKKELFTLETCLHATLWLYDVGGFIERQTNQQQKAKLEKQMYNTLTVRPNIVKPLLATGGEIIEPSN